MFSWFSRCYHALARRYRARRNRRLRRWAECAVLDTLDTERGRHAQELVLAKNETERVQRLLDSSEQALKEAHAKLAVKEQELVELWLVIRRNHARVEKEMALEAGAKALAEHGVGVLESQSGAAATGYVSSPSSGTATVG